MAFRNTIRYATDKQLFIAPEGVYSGQYIYCGKKATLNIGNVKPVRTFCRGGQAAVAAVASSSTGSSSGAVGSKQHRGSSCGEQRSAG